MSNKLCRQAIEARLYGWATARVPALRVVFENTSADPAEDETFILGKLLPNETGSETLEGDHRRYGGIYQMTIHAPTQTGPGAAEGILDELAALFPNNLRISVTGLTLQVVSPVSGGPSDPAADAYILPTWFTYRADVI